MGAPHSLLPNQPIHSSLLSAEEILSQMTLREKIGQLFITFFWGDTLSEETKHFFQRTKLGNIIYFSWANGLETPKQIAKLSNEVHDTIIKATKIPPLISADQEGGVVQRLQNGFTRFPGNMALGATNNPRLAYETGKSIAYELTSVGINFNLAPIVDVQTVNLLPWYMGVRTFGTDASQVIQFAQAQIHGFEELGLLYVLKHAPGLGSVSVNPHLALPTCNKTLSELEKYEFMPFKHLLKAPAIMTSHAVFSALDPENPASLSYKVTTELIRNTWGFKGIIITDSLSMNAVLEDISDFTKASKSVQKATIQAIKAGADCLILGRLEWTPFSPTHAQDLQVIEKAIEGLLESVQNGDIPEERINDSVLRIIEMKKNLFQKQFATSADFITPNERLATEIADQSLTLLSPEELFVHSNPKLSFSKICIIAPEGVKENLQEALKEKEISTDIFFFDPNYLEKNDFFSLQEEIMKKITQSDISLFFSSQETSLLRNLAQKFPREKLIFIGLLNPHTMIESKVYKTHNTMLTYSTSSHCFKAIFSALKKRKIPVGKLPFPTPE